MGSGKRIVRHSSNDLGTMVERGESETDWEALRAMTDAEVEAVDPEEAGWMVDWSRAEIHPTPRKTPMTIRLDPDVLAFFKAQGHGYQTKINAVLRAYMDHMQK